MKNVVKKYNELKNEVFDIIKKEGKIDLINVLEKEINILNLNNNPYAIARYIYIRLGEIFYYDTQIFYATDEVRKKLKQKRINPHLVDDFNLICDSYAYLYHDLLKHFNISSEVIDRVDHVYVLLKIDNATILADLTTSNEDITRIKFGLKPIYQRMIYPEAYKDDKTFDNVDKLIFNFNSEDVLLTIKNEFLVKEKINNWEKEEYIYQVFKFIENYFNFNREHIGFVSGITYVKYLIHYFISDYDINSIRFLNEFNNIDMEVVIASHNRYFIFFKEDNYYRFREISANTLHNCLAKYEDEFISSEETLVLRKR